MQEDEFKKLLNRIINLTKSTNDCNCDGPSNYVCSLHVIRREIDEFRYKHLKPSQTYYA